MSEVSKSWSHSHFTAIRQIVPRSSCDEIAEILVKYPWEVMRFKGQCYGGQDFIGVLVVSTSYPKLRVSLAATLLSQYSYITASSPLPVVVGEARSHLLSGLRSLVY